MTDVTRIEVPEWGAGLRSKLVPDTALCREAAEYAWEVSEPYLYHHVLRSFLFAADVGNARGMKADRELLFVACVLHDLGLTEQAPVQARFEVEGADMARAWGERHGMAPPQRELLWDAIALHTTLEIPQRKAPEIALCQLGAAIDIGFVPVSLVSRSVLQEALGHFPRSGLKQKLPSALCALHRRNPEAAGRSPVTRAAAQRMGEPLAPSPHLCDVIAAADFPE